MRLVLEQVAPRTVQVRPRVLEAQRRRQARQRLGVVGQQALGLLVEDLQLRPVRLRSAEAGR